MVKEIGELLNLPNLEEETVKVINDVLRHMVSQHKVTNTPQMTVGIYPFTDAKKQAEQLLGNNVLSEWINGPKEGD